MRWAPMILAAVSIVGSVAASSQGQGQVRAPEVPPTDTIAEDIPGVTGATTGMKSTRNVGSNQGRKYEPDEPGTSNPEQRTPNRT